MQVPLRLLPAERVIKKYPNTNYRSLSDNPINGTLIHNDLSEEPRNDHKINYGNLLTVPLACINNIDTKSVQKNNYVILKIACKDHRDLHFALMDINDANETVDKLRQYASPNLYNIPLFAYTYGERCIAANRFITNGWEIYNPEDEFTRQNIVVNGWKITNINADFKLSETYPPVLAVPKDASDELLKEVAKCRSKGRIPVLSWLHPVSKASLTRASQPLVGPTKKRLEPDIQMLKLIKETNANSNSLLIFDARPRVNAMANITVGGGVEDPSNYENIQYIFLNIQNIHAMRGSQTKITDACFSKPDDSKWFKQLSDSKWLYHLKQILFAATSIADKIENHKTSILVHCSDGWDRTAQITSLAMIMLDPHYRTIRGFEELIEKEWISFGHKFSQRTGSQAAGGSLLMPDSQSSILLVHSSPNGTKKVAKEDERSPVFLQFIDCVWQMTNQFKTAFEFNEKFLITIMDELYAGRFGTFLFDNLYQAQQNQCREKTISLWGYLNENLDEYRNPFYLNSEITGHRVIFPQHALVQLKLWTSYYLRWHRSMQVQDPIALRERVLVEAMNRFRTPITAHSQRQVKSQTYEEVL
ncbi:Myotubularin- protein 2 [Cichlidogyrus casuarinus]|uniref:Myotubularin- protein 2 n=1 Tax=Cichlidogyrus casuarinus TaxID=1844966 RepID=A0ABD2QMT3_9PLAT